jgi:hypothetical protein
MMDGHGFHQGYFHSRVFIHQQKIPKLVSAYARRAFDQGLGRSLWFVCAADPRRIANVIETFSDDRLPDLWSGVGLACAYAGGIRRQKISELLTLGKKYSECLAQGAIFAAEARNRAGNLVEHTEDACEILCNMSVGEASSFAKSTQVTARTYVGDDDLPTYEKWRTAIQERFKTR